MTSWNDNYWRSQTCPKCGSDTYQCGRRVVDRDRIEKWCYCNDCRFKLTTIVPTSYWRRSQ